MSSDNLSNAIERVLSDESEVREAIAPFQKEFPYDRDDEANVTRREFCNFLFLTSSALLVSSAAFAGKATYDARQTREFTAMKIDGAETLQPGSSLNFFYPDENGTAILIRSRDGQYHAYGQKCTHLTCPVYYAKEHDRIECPCHEAGFEVQSGRVLYGPPPRPLDKVEIEVRGNEVWALGISNGGDEHGAV
jgi:nitrite reductase/ring-hydroxylating ferredoxin subunit